MGNNGGMLSLFPIQANEGKSCVSSIHAQPAQENLLSPAQNHERKTGLIGHCIKSFDIFFAITLFCSFINGGNKKFSQSWASVE